jgi:hypothetical protein
MEQHPLAVKRLSREEAQQLVRGSRLDPLLYQSLVTELQTLIQQPGDALFITLPPAVRYATMKARLQRIGKHLHLALTIRKTEAGLVCWKETEAEETHRLSLPHRTHTRKRE